MHSGCPQLQSLCASGASAPAASMQWSLQKLLFCAGAHRQGAWVHFG